jgi:LysM repeat protein
MIRISWLIACFFTLTVSAQRKLVIMGKSPDNYIVYVTSGKESLKEVSNHFGLSVAKLSAYNKININAGTALPKASSVKIPVTKDNLLQHPADASAPVYYIVKKGDNLFRISQANYKVPTARIKEWNHLKSDVLKKGQPIIIGYMLNAGSVTGEADVAVNEAAPQTNTAVAETTGKKTTVQKKTEMPAPAPSEKKVAEVSGPAKADNKTSVAVLEPEKNKKPSNTVYTPKEGDEGYFAIGYSEDADEKTQQFKSGDAATFKSISGWTDRKFYVLMNDVAPKTIVRITGANKKTVCAMVLGPLQETKGASGLLLRVSNSAASALGLTEQVFPVTITYYE